MKYLIVPVRGRHIPGRSGFPAPAWNAPPYLHRLIMKRERYSLSVPATRYWGMNENSISYRHIHGQQMPVKLRAPTFATTYATTYTKASVVEESFGGQRKASAGEESFDQSMSSFGDARNPCAVVLPREFNAVHHQTILTSLRRGSGWQKKDLSIGPCLDNMF